MSGSLWLNWRLFTIGGSEWGSGIVVEAPSLADLIDEAEVTRLMSEYGPGQRWQLTVAMGETSFAFWWRKVVKKANRRGEVVLAIQRPDGKVLLHTKRFYPPGLFRLPSGGVHPDESVLAAVERETREETSLAVTIDRFVGMIEYEFRHRRRRMSFVSYVCLVQADDSRPRPADSGEEITGLKYVVPTEIRRIADELRSLPQQWSDWGAFRAPPHDMVADALTK